MNLGHLRYILEVERTKSYTNAAENLFMSQPNLSRSIRELELELGISVFRRTSKGMLPTRDGEEILLLAKTILEQVEEMSLIGRRGEIESQSFRLSAPRASYIAQAFARLAASLDTGKPIEADYKETNSLRTIDNVLKNNYHLGIVRYQTAQEEAFIALFREKELRHRGVSGFAYQALMSREHPLAEKLDLCYSDLEDCIELLHGDPYVPFLSHAQARKTELFHAGNKKIRVYERGSQFDLLRELPTAYMWASPVPKALLSAYGLVQKASREDGLQYKDVLIYRDRYKFTTLDQRFLALLEQCARFSGGEYTG